MAIGIVCSRADAIRLKEKAKLMRDPIDSAAAEKAADEYLCLKEKPTIGAGGELVPTEKMADDLPGLVDTMKNPNAVTKYASQDRISLAKGAGVLDMAIDMAETINAENSIEKSIAHQMSAAHKCAMNLFFEAERQRNPADKVRLTNAAARMMTGFQEAALTIQKLRGGGQQKVTVVHQHVQIAGGNVAVTGTTERNVT